MISSRIGVWGNCASESSELDFAFVLWLWAADMLTPSDHIVCSGRQSRQSDGRGGKKRKKVCFNLLCFLLRDVSVPQSSDWWILGPLEGGHEEGPEHCGWGWHDSHLTGCFPWTCRCSSAHMQQRVSTPHSSLSPVLHLTYSLNKLLKPPVYLHNYYIISLNCIEMF